jgi:hypothetical protein
MAGLTWCQGSLRAYDRTSTTCPPPIQCNKRAHCRANQTQRSEELPPLDLRTEIYQKGLLPLLLSLLNRSDICFNYKMRVTHQVVKNRTNRLCIYRAQMATFVGEYGIYNLQEGVLPPQLTTYPDQAGNGDYAD